VDEGLGKLYVSDRTSQSLWIVDSGSAAIAGKVALAAEPDYVRFVAATSELWVTEPSADQLEIFSLSDSVGPRSVARVPLKNGPESLVIDALRGRAYAHRWQATSVVFDLKTRALVAEWPNGCAASRGIALDEKRGWLFVACGEGRVSVLDVANGGKTLSTLTRGSGFDVIGYSAGLGHLYLAGGRCACLVTLGVDTQGTLGFLGRADAPASTHCTVADDHRHAWLCDPAGGRLLRYDDAYPAAW
jgi:DNA-binding beta-propeller fold protein YncE